MRRQVNELPARSVLHEDDAADNSRDAREASS